MAKYKHVLPKAQVEELEEAIEILSVPVPVPVVGESENTSVVVLPVHWRDDIIKSIENILEDPDNQTTDQ